MGESTEVSELLELVQDTEIVENIIYQCEHCGAMVDLLDTCLDCLVSINDLLIRLSQVLEFSLAFAIIVVFSVVCYSFLKNFTRF